MEKETVTAWYNIRQVEKIDSPALVIYKDRVEENIRLPLSMIDDPLRLRPHVKTHKTLEVCQLLMQAGIKKFKCATIAEAEMLGQVKATDVLLAYQPIAAKLQRFIALIKKYPDTLFSCLVDNTQCAKAIAESVAENGLSIPVYVDVNVGMNRTGISPARTMELYESAAVLQGIQVRGIHAYDGHIRSLDFVQRTNECNEAFAAIERLKDQLAAKGYQPLIIAGGSPTFPIHAARKDVECSPGTFVFWDRGYQQLCPEQPFLPAALVLTRIISLPDATKLCLDIGHKSIASENDLSKRIHFLHAADLRLVGHSEEHAIVEAPAGHTYKPGDVMYVLPFHICPTAALYERAIIIENNTATAEWKITARDRKITV